MIYFDDSPFAKMSVITTKHARERLYERFPEFCASIDSFDGAIISAVRKGRIVGAKSSKEVDTLNISFGDIGLIGIVKNNAIIIASVINSQLWIAKNHRDKKEKLKYNKKKRLHFKRILAKY